MAELVAKLAAERARRRRPRRRVRGHHLVAARRAGQPAGDGPAAAAASPPHDTVALMSGNRRELFEALVPRAHGGWVVVPVNWHWMAEELAYVLDDSGADGADRRRPVRSTSPSRPGRPGARTGARPGWSIGDAAPSRRVRALRGRSLAAASRASRPTQARWAGRCSTRRAPPGFPKGVRVHAHHHRRCRADAGADRRPASPDMLGLPDGGVTLLEGPPTTRPSGCSRCSRCCGGTTVVMRHKFDPAETLELIDRYGVTNVHLVPTQFIRLLKLPDARRAGFDGSSLAGRVPRCRALPARGEAPTCSTGGVRWSPSTTAAPRAASSR